MCLRMRVVIKVAWSVGQCENCGYEGQVHNLIITGGRFRSFCNQCESWQDFIVIAHDMEFKKADESG